MPIFAGFLFNIFAGLATWLAKYITQKMAVAMAIVSILTVMFVALYAGLRLAISAALTSAVAIHPMFAAGVSMVISPHSASLISSYIVFWSLVELYKWKVNIIQLWSRTI